MPVQWAKSNALPLLILAACLTLAGDKILDPSKPSSPPSPSVISKQNEGSHPSEGSEGSHSETSPPGEALSDGEKQRRMGIFHYNEGNKKLKAKNYRESAGHYQMALRHNPKFHNAYINLSTAYLRMGQYTEAIETLTSLKEVSPDSPQLHYNLACAYSLTGKQDAGLAALKESFKQGYPTPRDAESDPDLDAVRNHPEFAPWYGQWELPQAQKKS